MVMVLAQAVPSGVDGSRCVDSGRVSCVTPRNALLRTESIQAASKHRPRTWTSSVSLVETCPPPARRGAISISSISFQALPCRVATLDTACAGCVRAMQWSSFVAELSSLYVRRSLCSIGYLHGAEEVM
jgi:predicted molibdopterin-dependent oxidoreductase YjgC